MSAPFSIEIIPANCWGSNLKEFLSKEQWTPVRDACHRQGRYRCEICGGKGPKHPVEQHEIYHFDDVRHVQRLVRNIALCPLCHLCKHMGYADRKGQYQEMVAHICKINHWSLSQFNQAVDEAYAIYKMRSQYEWHLDLTWLKENHPELGDKFPRLIAPSRRAELEKERKAERWKAFRQEKAKKAATEKKAKAKIRPKSKAPSRRRKSSARKRPTT